MNDLSPIERITRDIKAAARTMSDQEARFLVDYYYITQEDRKRSANQVRALDESEEPNETLVWLAAQTATLEKQIARALDAYTESHMMGSWMRQIVGIGPIISAGMLAHIDITKAPTVGHIWRYAGIDPTTKWEKKEKRPWNAGLKTLCWKAGQSFMKFSGRDDCYYGAIYRKRKDYEIARNESGGNAEAAAARVGTVGEKTDAAAHYAAGRLPPAQIDARSRRYAVKLFLSHLHGEWYRRHFGAEPPLPYPIAHMGHAHIVPGPNP